MFVFMFMHIIQNLSLTTSENFMPLALIIKLVHTCEVSSLVKPKRCEKLNSCYVFRNVRKALFLDLVVGDGLAGDEGVRLLPRLPLEVLEVHEPAQLE